MPAILRVKRLADLAILELADHRIELRNEGSGAGPAQVTTLGRRARILRGDRGDGAEILSLEDALADLLELLAYRGVVRELIRLHEDVADMHLVHDGLLLFVPDVVDFHDVKAAGGSQRLADFARLELDNDVRQEGRQLGALAPPERPAIQRRLAVGVGDGELGEILTALGSLVDLIGALRGLLELLGSRGLSHG